VATLSHASRLISAGQPDRCTESYGKLGLDHLERDRAATARTRNARLAAIRSLFAFAALRHPEHAALIQRVLAIPGKRHDRTDVSFLTRKETEALIAAPDKSTRTGRRDHALLALAAQTGLRVSELTALRRQDLHLGTSSYLTCTGKGRKERSTPLTTATAKVITAWLREIPEDPAGPVFPGPRGGALSRDAIRRLVSRHCQAAAGKCPSLKGKNVTPHTLRHSCAMSLLKAGGGSGLAGLLCRAVTPVRGRALRGPRGRAGHPGRHPRGGQYRRPVPPAAAEPAGGDTAQLLVRAGERSWVGVPPGALVCGLGASGFSPPPARARPAGRPGGWRGLVRPIVCAR